MAIKKYLSLERLQEYDTLIKAEINEKVNANKMIVDDTLSSTSINPVQNKVIDAEFEAIATAMNALEDTVDGKSDADHGHLIEDVDGLQVELDKKSDTSHKHNYYGVCTTAAATAAKTVEIEGFELVTGAMVIVKFDNSNSASNPTLNVSGTGAKPMYRYGTTAISTGTTTTGWYADSIQMFVYDGTGWIRDYWNNTTYSNAGLGQGYGTCSTAAATVAKTATLSNYSLTTGGVVSIKFTNSVPAGATLNIASKGAKAIYYRGAAITDGVIKAGDIATFIYSGTYYHLLAIDRWQQDIESIVDEAKEYTDEAIATLVGTAPESLDTIHELANAFADNAELIETLNQAITNKADKEHSHDSYETKEDAQIKYDTIVDAKADWSQNDETAIDYIKNRTHWEAPMLTTIIPETTMETDYTVRIDNLFDGTYIVTVDGVSYTCEMFLNAYYEHCLGDSRLNPVLNDDGEEVPDMSNPMNVPFFANTYEAEDYIDYVAIDAWFLFPDSDTHTVKVAKVTGQTEVHPLDEKFIPDTIARKNEIAKADWNQNDESAIDYVKNRTHWVEQAYEVIVPTTTETDGIITSDDNLFIASQYIVVVDGVEYSCEVFYNEYNEPSLGDSRLNEGDMSNPVNLPFCASSYWDADWSNPFAGDVATVYVLYPDSEVHTIEIRALSDNSTYHTLDERYIPDDIARKNYVDSSIKENNRIYYGVCSDAENISLKTVNIVEGSFNFVDGSIVIVRFENGHDMSQLMSLNMLSGSTETGNRVVYYRGKKVGGHGSDTRSDFVISAGDIVTFIVYDNYFHIISTDRLHDKIMEDIEDVKTEIDNLELITVEDIDAICGGAIQYAEDVMF